jgi:acyl-coenzyme A thioesterase PaaI-like protein
VTALPGPVLSGLRRESAQSGADGPELSQQHGCFQGGIIGTIADSSGRAALTRARVDTGRPKVKRKSNLPASGDGNLLVVRPEGVPQASSDEWVIGCVKGSREKLCATLLQVLIARYGRADS